MFHLFDAPGILLISVGGRKSVMVMRVLICSVPSMFSQGLEACISGNHDLELIGRAGNPEEAVQRIKEMKPDVVLLVSSERGCHPWVDIERLLNDGTNTRIIDLDLKSDVVGVFLGEQQRVTEFDDLVKIILKDDL